MEKQNFLNTKIHNITLQDVLAWVEKTVPERRSAAVVELNVDVIMKIEHDAELRRISDEADLTLVDGKPLIWISQLQHRPVKEKISGSDLMLRLCELGGRKGYSIFILGGSEEASKAAGARLCADNPGLKLAGTYSPPFGFEKDEAECEKICKMIDAAAPDLLFVCFGCPKQEKWLAKHRSRFTSGVCLCAGASVDFAAGRVKRAPKWMSDHGLEWFYRFLCEPKRLFKRYFIDDMQIVGLMLKYRK